ncbi:unnamed protein product, partial [marine sediment metagenome]
MALSVQSSPKDVAIRPGVADKPAQTAISEALLPEKTYLFQS